MGVQYASIRKKFAIVGEMDELIEGMRMVESASRISTGWEPTRTATTLIERRGAVCCSVDHLFRPGSAGTCEIFCTGQYDTGYKT